MTEAFYSSLLDFGMGGLFIAFLVYNWISNQKRLDKQLCHFTEQLKEQSSQFRVHVKEAHEKAEVAEEKLRIRYDDVIEVLNKDKLEFNTSLLERANEAMRQFGTTKTDLESLKVKSDSLEILTRDCLFILQRVDDILKSQDEERKVKAMAKRLRDERES